MRVLRLELGNELGAIDLHPFVTVVQGLDADAAGRVVAAVQALARGDAPGVGGLVENEGLLIELEPGGVAPVGPFAVSEVALDADRLPVDTTEELPALWARYDQLCRRAAIDAARLEEVRTQLDASAAAHLERLEVDRDATVGVDPEARAAVAAAVEAWSATPATVFVASPWVVELSRQWDDHRRRGAACEMRLATLERRVQAASRRLAAAVAALDGAQAAAVPLLLDPEEENRLAELATRPVARGRLRSPKGRPEEDQSEIDQLLARVGQPTYASYVMFRMAPTPPPEQLATINAARAAVTKAEHELATATRARDDDPDLAAHRHRRDALRAVVADRLGPLLPDELQQVLSAQGEHQPNPERAAARRNLLAVASRHGVPCPETADDGELADRIRRWLGVEAGDDADPGAGPEEVAALRRRVARHRQALEAIDGLERRAGHSRRLIDEVDARIAAVGQRQVPSAGAIIAAVDRMAADAASAGAVPLVLSGTFGELPDGSVPELLDRLELEAQRVQLLVVTDHAEAGRWADEVGLRRALRTCGAARRN